MTAELGNRLVDFFKTPGPYAAFPVGGGDWNWRRNPDADWQRLIRRVDAYAPWNIGNYTIDAAGDKHASTHYWADDKHDCEKVGVFWLPVAAVKAEKPEVLVKVIIECFYLSHEEKVTVCHPARKACGDRPLRVPPWIESPPAHPQVASRSPERCSPAG